MLMLITILVRKKQYGKDNTKKTIALFSLWSFNQSEARKKDAEIFV